MRVTAQPHRPRKDPKYARVQISATVHPQTRKKLRAAAKGRKLSMGLLLDEIAAMLPNVAIEAKP
jgi:hypothetical protein